MIILLVMFRVDNNLFKIQTHKRLHCGRYILYSKFKIANMKDIIPSGASVGLSGPLKQKRKPKIIIIISRIFIAK